VRFDDVIALVVILLILDYPLPSGHGANERHPVPIFVVKQ